MLVAGAGGWDWPNLLTGFLSGLLLALVGAWAESRWQRQVDRNRQAEAIRFRIYMKMMGLQNPLLWMSCSETHNETINPKHLLEAERMSWMIADELRSVDDLPQMEEILRVLFSKQYRSAKDRHDALRQVLDNLGRVCNPNYRRVMTAISLENLRHMDREMQERMTRGAPPLEEHIDEPPRES